MPHLISAYALKIIMTFFSFGQIKSIYHMIETLPLLSDFEKILFDRINELRHRIHKADNPIYKDILMIEIETPQWILSQTDG
jgi:hypothetical protein